MAHPLIAVMRKPMIMIVALFILGSCKKEGVTNPDPPAHVNTLSASVNGVAYSSKDIEISVSGSITPGARTVSVYSRVDNGKVFLSMNTYDGTIKIFNKEVGCYSNDWPYEIFYCGDKGEIVLTSIDKDKYKTGHVVNGSFHFEVYKQMELFDITDGNFSFFIPDN